MQPSRGAKTAAKQKILAESKIPIIRPKKSTTQKRRLVSAPNPTPKLPAAKSQKKTKKTPPPSDEVPPVDAKIDSKYQGQFAITRKVYPTSYVNQKGTQIGNIKVNIDYDDLPFSYADQVNYTLHGLVNYAKKQKGLFDKTEHNSFVNHKKTMKFIPIHVSEEQEVTGGNRKKTTRRRRPITRNKKNKSNRIMYK
jgi:hypothetical protein